MYKLLLLFTVALMLAGGAYRTALGQSESSAIEQIQNENNLPISEPMIAVNPANANNFITSYSNWVNNGPTRLPGVSYTTDGGASWSTTDVPTNDANFLDRADPSIAFDANGNAFYCWLTLQYPSLEDSSAVRVSESTDQGKDWSGSPFTVDRNSGSTQLDKPWVVCDQSTSQYRNSIYVVYVVIDNFGSPNNATYTIYFSLMRSGQTSFSTPVAISQTVGGLTDVEAPYPVIGNDGSVYVFWAQEDNSNATDQIMMNKSTNGGQSWSSTPQVLFSSLAMDDGRMLQNTTNSTSFAKAHTWPSVAVNPTDGSLNLVYGSGGSVYYTVSKDGGSTWSTPSANGLGASYPAQAWSPTIACNPSGQIAVAYYFAGAGADQGSSSQDQTDVYVATSPAGGGSFTVHSAGSVSFNPLQSPYGDYIGVAYNDNTYWAVWPQASGTNTNLYGRYRTVSAIAENMDANHNVLQGTTISFGPPGNETSQSSPYTTPYILANDPEALTAGSQQTVSGEVYDFYHWEDENGNVIGTSEDLNINIGVHQYRAIYSPDIVPVAVKNQFTDPNGTLSYGGTINIDGTNYTNTQNLSGQEVTENYQKGSTHTFTAQDQTYGSYYRGFNPYPNDGGGWVEDGTALPGATDSALTVKVQASTYLAPYRNQYTVNVNGATEFDGTASNTSSPESVWQYNAGVTAPSTFTYNNHNYAFTGWSDGSTQNPDPNPPTDNMTYTADYKGLQLSSDPNAYLDNSQRKMVQTPNGYLFEAYTDDSHVWVEYSSNQGSSWTLANNGEPLDYDFVTQSNPASKCPSLDYDPSNNDVIVVFEEQNGNYYNIDYDVFTPSGSSYINLFDQQPATVYQETSDAYSVNANTDFAVYDGYWVIAFEQKTPTDYQTAGINILFGTFNTDENLQVNGPFYISGTNSGSTLPSIYGAKTQSNWFTDIVWQQGSGTSSTIEFSELVFSGVTMDTSTVPITISNSAWPANYQPSLVQEPNSTAWVCWIANNLGRPPMNITLFSTAPGASNYNTIDYNESSVSVNLPNGGSTPYIAFSQASASDSWTDYACNYNASSMITLGTTGRDMQLSNGASTSSMYASAFNPSSSPYPLEISGNISGAGNSPAGNVNTVASLPIKMTYGRGGTISDGNLNFYYSFRNLSVDGQSIGFAPSSDSTDYDSLSSLNRSLVTDPFQVNTNSRIVFSEYSGFADSSAAISVLGDTGYIDYNVEVIDNTTGKLVGTIENIRLTASNAGGYRSNSYLLSSDGISNETVKVKIDVSTNLTDSKFALINSYSQVDSSSTENLQSLSLEPITVIKDFTLSQNYPNPFNPTTVIDYTIPKDSHVTLKIYDVLGQEVRTLVDEDQQVGRYSVNFNGSSLASGVYFYRLVAGSHVITKKMLELK